MLGQLCIVWGISIIVATSILYGLRNYLTDPYENPDYPRDYFSHFD